MRKTILLYILLLAIPISSTAQDWFDDTRSEGVSIINRGSDGGNKKYLFAARFNTKDGIALNFFNWTKFDKFGVVTPSTVKGPRFQFFRVKEQGKLKTAWGESAFKAAATNSHKYQGFGIALKTKADEGLGYLFSAGQFADGFSGNIYYAGERVLDKAEREFRKKNNTTTSFRFWALNLGLTSSAYRFYRPLEKAGNQLSDFELFTGIQAGYSYYSITKNSGGSSVIRGVSVSYRLKNNYSSLPKVTIKDILAPYTIGKDSLRSVEYINKYGSTYALEDAKNKFTPSGEILLRFQLGIIPTELDNKKAFLVYPEAAVKKSKLSANLGFGVQFLKDKQPLISNAGIFFRFNDIFNSASAEDVFFKRSFELGVTASLNILTGTIQ